MSDKIIEGLQKAVNAVGSKKQLSEALNISVDTVYKWFKRKNLPQKYPILIEKITNGKVKRQDLRPDLYPD